MIKAVLELLDPLRKKQVESEFYKNFNYNIANISVLPLTLRKSLIKKYNDLLSVKIVSFIPSNDKQTIKAVLERKVDGLKFESVLMKYRDGRNAVCFSSMIGCPLNCLFCATGKMGFKANLSDSEIIDQFIIWANYLKLINCMPLEKNIKLAT